MKKIALLFFTLMAATPAYAGVSCSLPFNIQNATTADATQVMANYNALVACLANAAAAGANNDITSLSALSTPLTPSQGGSNLYVGSNSTGTTAIVVSTTTPSNFSLAVGRKVTFIAGSTNVAGASTLNVAGTGAISFVRRIQSGLGTMAGGEMISGQMSTAVYNGTQWELDTPPYVVGEIKDFAGTTAPPGWAAAAGECATRATFPDLFALIGTSFDPGGVCDVNHFAMPDGRGRAFVGLDGMFGTPVTSRITNAASGCDGTLIGLGCGAQTRTIAQANLPAYNLSVTDPGHTHNYTLTGAAGTPQGIQGGSGVQAGTVATGSATTGISVNLNGGGTGLPILPPLQIVTKIIKL